MPRELTDYGDGSVEPTDPGAIASQHHSPSFQRMQSLLEAYEERFPEEAFVEVSLALVGKTDIRDAIDNAKDALASDEPDFTDEQRSLLSDDIDLLTFLEDRCTTTVEMRQYKSDVDARDLNERAVDGDGMTLAANAKAITNTLHGQVFNIGTNTAFVYNTEPQSPNSTFSVKVGRWKGYFDVDIFDTDIDTHLENKFFDDNWYTPERLNQSTKTHQ